MNATPAQKKAARVRVRYAVLHGKLAKEPCRVCGAERVEAHHPDYTQPLLVQWLCPTHHRAVHGQEFGRYTEHLKTAVDCATKARLVRYAAKVGKSESAIIRPAIRDYLAKHA